jgi:hypothetical protein
MTEKIEELSLKQTATTERNQETRIQDNDKLLSPMTGALSVLSYPPSCSFHSSYLDLRDLGHEFLTT